ncbi:MAG: type I-E CRISPR-associated protein Cas6/Cse3/CasE [Verrucomicrobiales bacterium]
MAFLTQAQLGYEHAFKAGFRDAYDWHQKVWEAFPSRNGQPRKFLTRLDELDGAFRLLILSVEQPERPVWWPEQAWKTKAIAPTFWEHSRFRFSLVANPTVKVRSSRTGQLLKNSRRVPIVKREALLGWLERKGQQNGFVFDPSETKTVPRPIQRFIKKGSAGAHAATEFVGQLTVTDHEIFQQAAIQGVGPAKAFGFGMLCLAPIRDV